jgi:hypothetical protein
MVYFHTKKMQFLFIFEGLGMENVGIVYGRLEYCKAIGCMLWSFGIFFPVLVCSTNKKLATM